LQEAIDTIVILREKVDHGVLESLEKCFRNSIEDVIDLASDIAQADVWLKNISNILLGSADKNGNRKTDEYKKQVTAGLVEQHLQEYILNLVKTEKHSAFLKKAIDHFRITFNNWKRYLFTCYDHCFLPNTNLDLELSHSRMKRKHRKITGQKNSHNFLLNHGEHFSFCFNFNHSSESLSTLLRSLDIEKIRNKTKEESSKSKQRYENRLTIKNLPVVLKNIMNNWY